MPSTLTQHRAGQAANTGGLSRKDWELIQMAKARARKVFVDHPPASAHRTRTALECVLASGWFADMAVASTRDGIDEVCALINAQLAHAGLELRRKPTN